MKPLLRTIVLTAAVVLPVASGMVSLAGPAAAQSAAVQTNAINSPAQTSQQAARAEMLRVLELGAFAVMLDRAWDYMAVAPYNSLDAALGAAQTSGVARYGLSAVEADAIIQRGFATASAFTSANGKHSREGRAMVATMKAISSSSLPCLRPKPGAASPAPGRAG